MSLEKAVQNMINLVTDESHGYSQTARTGPDYDCSSSIYFAIKNAGLPVPASPWATSSMLNAMTTRGWEIVGRNYGKNDAGKLKRGDVLLNPGKHTEMYIGNGQMAGFNINELGKISGGKPGDQTGRESWIKPYNGSSKGAWDYVLRYKTQPATAPITAPVTASANTLKRGSKGKPVGTLQAFLNLFPTTQPKLTVDDDFGSKTETALITWQKANGLPTTGTLNLGVK